MEVTKPEDISETAEASSPAGEVGPDDMEVDPSSETATAADEESSSSSQTEQSHKNAAQAEKRKRLNSRYSNSNALSFIVAFPSKNSAVENHDKHREKIKKIKTQINGKFCHLRWMREST